MRKTLLMAVLCPWVLFSMYQDATVTGGYWWKPIEKVGSAAVCRQMVKNVTGRQTIALISWYHFPELDGKAPDWLRAVMAAKPKGGVEPWIGCLPSGYDPHEPH